MQGPLARAVFEQGDIGDGGIGRDQFAEVLVRSLMSDAAIGWTFELFAGPGRPPTDCDDLFEALTPDAADALDGARVSSVCRRSTTSPRAFARTRSHQETAVMSAAIPTPGRMVERRHDRGRHRRRLHTASAGLPPPHGAGR
jgi:hypothetical protein